MEKIKPIFSYFGFLSRSVLKRKSIWIVFSILLICGFIVSLTPNFIGFENGVKSYSSFFNVILPISITIELVASCFAGVLSFLIPFKDGESDGMELLIVSKPITRLQIILSRIFFFCIMSIGIGLLTLTFAGISYEVLHAKSITYMGIIIFDAFLYEKGLYLGGMFGASLMGFLIFGFISASISLMASGKATRIIAISTIAISGMASNLLSNMSSIIPSGITSKIIDETVDVLNNEYKGKNLSEVASWGDSSEIIKSFSIESWSFNYQSMLYDDNLYGYIGISYIDVKYHDNHNNYDSTTSVELSKIKPETWKIIGNRVGDSVGASGVTAVNYLNPLSALTSIVSSKPLSFFSGIPYNISASNITPDGEGGFTFKATPADPSWGVALMWVGILILLGTGITFGYLRKDFK